MFQRQHRIGVTEYYEVLEAYRDEAGKPRHRVVARWHAQYGPDLRHQISHAKLMRQRARRELHKAEYRCAHNPPDPAWAQRELDRCRRSEAQASKHLAGLEAAEDGLVSSGKLEALPAAPKAPRVITDLEGNGGRWRVRKLTQDGFPVEWHVEWSADGIAWQQFGTRYWTRRVAVAAMLGYARDGVEPLPLRAEMAEALDELE